VTPSVPAPAGSRLTALVVLPDLPLLEGGALGRFFVALLRGLSSHGVDARAIAARRTFTPAGSVPADLDVEVIEVPQPHRLRSRAYRLLRPAGDLALGEFASRIREAGRSAQVLHLESVFASLCDHGLAIPSAVHLHYLARHDRAHGPPWRKQFWQVSEETLAERAAVRRHRHLIVSSPVVRDALRRRATRARITLAPLCLAPENYRRAPLDGSPTAGLIGTAAWAPTAGAIVRSLGRIWPLVHREVPESRLLIAGRGSSQIVTEPPPGVEVVGEVRSGADFLHGLSLLLYPAVRGSGMKVKVIEALASGVPVVTTRVGAEGIAPSHGIVVAEDDASIAQAAISLLRDPHERRDRGAAARETFRANYTPEIATLPLVDLYREMAEGT
jgi:glycosyltransferase involved in cell wall biosynthesis